MRPWTIESSLAPSHPHCHRGHNFLASGARNRSAKKETYELGNSDNNLIIRIKIRLSYAIFAYDIRHTIATKSIYIKSFVTFFVPL